MLLGARLPPPAAGLTSRKLHAPTLHMHWSCPTEIRAIGHLRRRIWVILRQWNSSSPGRQKLINSESYVSCSNATSSEKPSPAHRCPLASLFLHFCFLSAHSIAGYPALHGHVLAHSLIFFFLICPTRSRVLSGPPLFLEPSTFLKRLSGHYINPSGHC